jgi:hypothetical protein
LAEEKKPLCATSQKRVPLRAPKVRYKRADSKKRQLCPPDRVVLDATDVVTVVEEEIVLRPKKALKKLN